MLTLVAVLALSQVGPLRESVFPAYRAHQACNQEDAAQGEVARALYVAFLSEHPGSELDGDVRYFFAELLNDTFHERAAAIALYRQAAALPGRRRWFAGVELIHALPPPSASTRRRRC